MNKFVITTFLIISMTCSAEVSFKFSPFGGFMPPDQIIQNRGIKAYKQGYTESAIRQFKSSAKFGNDMSKYLTGVMYLKEKNWVTGYAWLKLVDQPIEKNDELIKSLDEQLSTQELKLAEVQLQQLKEQYNPVTYHKRRMKWQKSLKFTGTNIPGFKGINNKNLGLSSPDGLNVNQINSGFSNATAFTNNTKFSSRNPIENYVYEYLPQGKVNLGEIKTTD